MKFTLTNIVCEEPGLKIPNRVFNISFSLKDDAKMSVYHQHLINVLHNIGYDKVALLDKTTSPEAVLDGVPSKVYVDWEIEDD